MTALATGGTAAGLFVSNGDDHPQPPRPVLGQSLAPLTVYPVAVPQGQRSGAGQRLVPDMGRPGHSILLGAKPVIDLHVRYARVRPVVGHWQLELIAPEGATFTAQTTQGEFYDVVIDGKALALFFVVGDHRGVNFGIGAGADWVNQADAVKVARSLTTSVSVAQCSSTAIAANECP